MSTTDKKEETKTAAAAPAAVEAIEEDDEFEEFEPCHWDVQMKMRRILSSGR